MEKPDGHYLYLCCRGRWNISEVYAALKGVLRHFVAGYERHGRKIDCIPSPVESLLKNMAFATLMRVFPEKLGLPGEEALDVMDIKCNTIMISYLLSATSGKTLRPNHVRLHFLSTEGKIPFNCLFQKERHAMRVFLLHIKGAL